MDGIPVAKSRTGPRRARGFSLDELKRAGTSIDVVRRLGLYVDLRRRSGHDENVQALRGFLRRRIDRGRA